MNTEASAKAPWHLWAVGVLSLLWNAAGAVTIVMAQAGKLPGIKPDEAAYYAAQPMWFVAVTDVSLLAAISGSVLLLMRKGKAVRAFALSLVAILITHAYDIAMGTSRSFANQGAMAVNIIILVIAVLVLLYASAMKKQGVLR